MKLRERTELLIRGMTENRTKRHRWLAMVTALAFLTGGNVFWSLREIGTAVTEDDLCTREAHEHSEECYDENGDLICGKEEHVHTAACFSDENADVETAEIWEATIPEREGLSRQEQAALIAESQLGYAESTNNFILGEDGVQHGYTRYGAWYGNPYGEWNTMFIYFCLYYAGVSAEEIPCIGNARTWQVKLSECGLIRGPDTEPERGEVILLDLDADGEADLTGIITDAAETLHFVEGDLGHAVAVGELAPDAEQILGFVAIPEPDAPDAENPEESPPENAEESPPDAEPAPTEKQPAASESEQPLVTYRAEAPSGIQVSAVAAEGVFPADTMMTVTDVPREEALQAAEHLEADALDAVAVDISFTDAAGAELEPNGAVEVQITLPEALYLSGSEYDLLHVSDEGEVQRVVEAEISQNGAGFTAESFSMYVLIAGKVVEKSNVVMLNGDKGNNSQTNPYVIGIGENIEVWYSGEYIDKSDQYSRGFTVYQNSDNKVIRTPGKESEIIEGEYRKAFFTGNSEGVCQIIKTTGTGAWESNDSIADYLWVKVVDHPIFIMQYGKRVLFNDSTISASVGDTITLSVNGSHPELLAPVDGSDTSQGYKISDTLYRGKPNYDNGNTFVTFVCTKDGTQAITVNGKTITFNVTNDKLYRVIGGNRYEVHDGQTLKVYGDQVILSVNGQAAHLLNPDSNYNFAASYLFCDDFLYRNAPAGSDYGGITVDGVVIPTTNVRFDCKKLGTSGTFTVNGKTVRVEVAPVYMILSGKRVPLDEALLEMNKTTDHNLYGIEGETFTFSFNGENNNLITELPTEYFDVKPVNVDGNTNVTITCKKHFAGQKSFRVNGEDYKIEVEHPIYVVEKLHDRDIDRINEWLQGYNLPKENGYVPNRLKTADWDYDRRYILFNNDELVLRVPLNDDLSSASLVIEDGKFEVLGGSLTSNGSAINVKLKAINTESDEINTQIDLKDSAGNTIRTMFITIKGSSGTSLNHADIEIADGGKYSITKIKRHADGSIEKTITLFDAYIGEINSGTVYRANDTVCQDFLNARGDYWKDPTLQVGSSQYEYTSAYTKDAYGNVTHISERWFSSSEADHVVFDTNLELIPDSVQTITYNADGEETGSTKHTFSETERQNHEMRDNVMFTMEHQEIVDALNKCPLHNGLDFTITAFAAMVEFDMNKDLTGGTIMEDQFSFDLIKRSVQASASILKENSGETEPKSSYESYLSQGLVPKLYRIVYTDDGTINGAYLWGTGIDGPAVIAELTAIPGCEDLNSAQAVFYTAIGSDEGKKQTVLQVLKKHLMTPETLTESSDGTSYVIPQAGFHLLAFDGDEPVQTSTNKVLETASGEKRGVVTFDKLHFDAPGMYNYIIKETAGSAENILYDDNIIEMQIQVTKGEHNELIAEIINPSQFQTLSFTNHTTYRLPDTGGSGTLPWYLGGTVILAAATLLMIKKRREGS